MKQPRMIIALFAAAFCINPPLIASEDEDDDSDRGWPQFSNRSIQGKWGFSGGLGYIVPPDAPELTPVSGLGTVYFDGRGGCVVKSTVNVAGTLVGPATSDSCTYSVNPDGTGVSTAWFSEQGAPESSSIAFVIVEHGRELRAINTDALVGGFVAKRQY